MILTNNTRLGFLNFYYPQLYSSYKVKPHMEVYTVKVEEATQAKGEKPAAGPVYRSIYAKNGLLQLPNEINSPWDLFRSNSLYFLHLT
jgi:hypothetical protein